MRRDCTNGIDLTFDFISVLFCNVFKHSFEQVTISKIIKAGEITYIDINLCTRCGYEEYVKNGDC